MNNIGLILRNDANQRGRPDGARRGKKATALGFASAAIAAVAYAH